MKRLLGFALACVGALAHAEDSGPSVTICRCGSWGWPPVRCRSRPIRARTFGDDRLGSTYYAVAANEALSDRPAFAARAGLISWHLKAGVSRQLTPELRVFAFGRADSMAGAANRASPLVRQTTGASVAIGLTYTLMRSSVRTSD